MRSFFLTVLAVSALALPASAQLASDNPPPLMAPLVAEGRTALVAGDHERALSLLRPLAEAGDAIAENMMGAIYEHGLGVPEDAVTARQWYERSAQQGNPQAQMNLGMLLSLGATGVPVDGAEARRWFQLSVDQDYGPANAALGRLYEAGLGGAPDLARALALYESGRAAGDPWASEYLAHLYRLGNGVPEDIARARALFTEAANEGLGQSMNNLAFMMEQGHGGAQDIDGAERLYRQARETGHLRASYNLVWLLFENRNSPEARAEIVSLCTEIVPLADEEDYIGWSTECANIRKQLIDED